MVPGVSRSHVTRPVAVKQLTRAVPVRYVLFDVLYLDGRDVMALPYERRRDLLESLRLDTDAVRTLGAFHGAGEELLRATREQGLEGIMAKRVDSPYVPGQRVSTWRKVKHTSTQEVVISGWKPGKGARAGGVGSLLIGVCDDRGLRYAGHVGAGFTERTLDELGRLLRPLETSTSPYVDDVPREFARDAHWVRPELVGEVTYTTWTKEGRLRGPSWKGFREDVPPEAARADHG